MFAPDFTACCSTVMVAMDVVTIPLATVDTSPAFSVSSESTFQSTPMFFLIRSITSPAVTAGVAGTNGAAATAAARAANSRLDRSAMLWTNHSRVPRPDNMDSMSRRWAMLAVILAGCAGPAISRLPSSREMLLIRGHEQSLYLYGPARGDPVILSSGDGGWIHLGPHVAEFLAAQGFFVVGFDVKAYLSGFTSRDT